MLRATSALVPTGVLEGKRELGEEPQLGGSAAALALSSFSRAQLICCSWKVCVSFGGDFSRQCRV